MTTKPALATKPDSWARPHQVEAINDVVKGFKNHDRGQCIMACGTGKTRVGLRIAEKLESRCTLILVPSLLLVAQVIKEWQQNYDGKLSILAVCSDQTVSARGKDHDDFTPAQLREETNVTVTTQPAELAAFMRQRGDKVVIGTYQSSEVVDRAQHRRGTPAFDLVISDEAHRTAGHLEGTFATVVREDGVKAKKRLFMTATPRVFGSRKSDDGGFDAVEVASMDDIKLYGPVFHRLGFTEAVSRGLLVDWKCVVAVVYDDEVSRFIKGKKKLRVGRQTIDARTAALHVALNKVILEHRLKKVITFHSRVFKAADFAAQHNLVTLQLPKALRVKNQWVGHVTAYQDSRQRAQVHRQFTATERDTTAILTNARCLTEGFDSPELDAIMFADPRRSSVEVVQAVGRVMRVSPGKNVGLIVVPVLARGKAVRHASKNEVWDDVMEPSEFANVREVLMALRSNDESFGAAMSSLNARHAANPGARLLTVDESAPGIRAGTAVEAREENTVVSIRNGKALNAEGKEVVVSLPKNLSISAGARTQVFSQKFTQAIANRVVRWTVDYAEHMALKTSAFVKAQGHLPRRKSDNAEERALANWTNSVRQKYRDARRT